MRLGATLARLAPGPPLSIAETARRLVAEGFESLWVPQIVGRGYLVADPFVTLAVAATATDGVELGTATLQVPLHHPVDLAHRIHSLALVCGDRLTLGVSPGSTDTDFAAFDRDYATRFATLRRHLDRLRPLLETGTDAGVELAPAGIRPRPPLLLGSWGANVERAAHDFDGWLASGLRRSPDQIVAALGRFRAAGGGRAVVCAIPVTDDLGPIREALQRFAEAGFDDAVVLLPEPLTAAARVRALV